MRGNLKFLSEEHHSRYFKHGYLTIPFLNPYQVSQLEQIFNRNFDISAVPSVYDTVADIPIEKVESVYHQINEVCQSNFDKVVKNYRIVASIFIIKKSEDDSYKGVHLDASMTLEGYNNIGIWIPLCDVDEQTGRICLLDNSHHFLPPYNIPSMPCAFHHIESIVEQHLTCISMRSGDALFFNNSMLHCTQKNRSGKTRIAVVIKLIDVNAPKVTAYYDENSPEGKKLRLYQHEDNFFLPGAFKMPMPPPSSRFVGYVPELPRFITEEEFFKLRGRYS